jgi:CRP/FNR family transcriptional regulator
VRKVPCERCAIRDTSCIADLPVEKLDEFRACSASAIYKRRQVIFHEGAPATGLYILCQGAVKLYQSDRFGHEHILTIAGTGDVLGELPIDPLAPYSASAEAVTDSQLCFLPRERLVPFIETHPMTGVRLIAALSQALALARKKARTLALKGAESRLAELLLHLAGVNEEEPHGAAPRLTLGYSRRELAEMIGVSTETAIRLLGRLKQKQAIETSHRDLLITDLDKLARIANHDAVAQM